MKELKMTKIAIDNQIGVKKAAGKIQDIYNIGMIVGQGAFGEVRKVEHKSNHSMRCVKIMTKGLMQSNQIKRVHYEIELLKRCNHPNIVKLYEFYETSEKIYIVMERC